MILIDAGKNATNAMLLYMICIYHEILMNDSEQGILLADIFFLSLSSHHYTVLFLTFCEWPPELLSSS